MRFFDVPGGIPVSSRPVAGNTNASSFNETAAGGCKCAGTATISVTYNTTVSSGDFIGGSSTQQVSYNVLTSSGDLAGGTNTQQVKYNTTPSGGDLAGGTGTQQFVFNPSVAGGDQASGSNTQIASYNVTTSGGDLASGTNTQRVVFSPSVAGGDVCGGTATLIVSFSNTISGGDQLGGTVSNKTLISPASMTNLGGISNATPFDVLASTIRYQQIYPASDFQAGQITQIAFRRRSTDATFSNISVDIRINLAVAATTVATASSTFSTNIGSNNTTVFDGVATVSSTSTGSDPLPYEVVFNFTTPFSYNPSQGDLLLDIIVRNRPGFDLVRDTTASVARIYTNTTTGSYTDLTGTVETTGLVSQFLLSSNNLYVIYNPTVTSGDLVGGSSTPTTKFNITTTGGDLSGGTSSQTYIYNVSVSGGDLASGTSTQNASYNISVSGGDQVGGTSSSTSSYSQTSSGGDQVSGSSTANAIYSVISSSGDLVSGSSTLATTYSITTSSGDLVSGTSTQQATYSVSSTAGDLASGTGTTAAKYNITTSSGDLASGTSTAQVTYSVSSTAGDLSSGTSTTAANYNTTSTGGDLASGTSTQTAIYNVSVSGGSLVGGSGSTVSSYSQSTSGGDQVGGSASLNVRYNISPTSGDLVGGSNVQQIIFNPSVSGGGLCGGSATVTVSFSATTASGDRVSGTVNNSVTISPATMTNLAGATNLTPFGVLASTIRYQQIYPASDFQAGPITQIAFRRGAATSTFTNVAVDIKINLAVAATTVGTASTTFASNIGSNNTTVFDGIATVSSTSTGSDPLPYDVVFNFTTPFNYNPTQGDLLLDIIVRNQPNLGLIRDTTASVTRIYTDTTSGSYTDPTGTIDPTGLVTQFTISTNNLYVIYNPSSSGGTVSSGSGTTTSRFVQTVSGGDQTGGTSTQQATYSVTATSGDLASGTSTQQATYSVTTTSGDLASGTSTQQVTYNLASASGDLTSGTSTQHATYNVATSGGVVCSGTNIQQSTYSISVTSGDLSGGTSTAQVSYSATSSGGVSANSASIISPTKQDLLHYYRFESNTTAGNQVPDERGNGNLSDPTSTTSLVSGLVGNAIHIGTEGLIGSASDTLASNTSWAISVFVKFNNITSDQWIIDKGASAGAISNAEYGLWYDHVADRLKFVVVSGTSATTITANAFGGLDTTNWHHVVVGRDSGNIYIVVDTVQDSVAYALSINAPQFYQWVVGSTNAFTNQFSGSIDEIGVFTKWLSTSDISFIYNGGSGTTYSNYPDSSSLYVIYNPSVSSGALCGGVATVIYNAHNEYNETATGGILVGGTSTQQATYTISCTGGDLVSGTAILLTTYDIAVSGGNLVSGTSTPTATYNLSITGGDLVSGTSTPTATYNLSITGGDLVSGTSTPTATYDISIAGGNLVGGTGTLLPTYNETATGGDLVSGTSTPTATYNVASTGGDSCNGVAGIQATYSVTAVSGDLCAGSVTSQFAYNLSVSGGCLYGGNATITVSFVSTATSGDQTGGTVNNSVTISPATMSNLAGATNLTPFGVLASTIRYQQIYPASDFQAGPITQIAFRRRSDAGTFTNVAVDIKINLAIAATTVGTASATFANNIGSNNTTVFDGVTTVSSTSTGSDPLPYDVVFTFTTPFNYNPTQGDLLLDIIVRNQPNLGLVRDTTASVVRIYTDTTSGSYTDPTGTIDPTGLVTQFLDSANKLYVIYNPQSSSGASLSGTSSERIIYLVTATSGDLCSGSSLFQATYNISASSGALCGGVATVIYNAHNEYNETATGGVVCAGDSTRQTTFNLTASDGNVCAGDSTQQTTYSIVVTSGDVCAGNSDFGVTITVSSAGGGLCGGTAAPQLTYSIVSASGDKCDGSSTQQATYSVVATSGDLCAGNASVIAISANATSGGCLASGDAVTYAVYNETSTGGLLCSSRTGVIFDESSAGGVKISGNSTIGIEKIETVSGGATSSGAVIVAGTYRFLTSGGINAGGSSNLVFSHLPSGGIRTGGSSGVDAVYSDSTSGGVLTSGSATIRLSISSTGGVQCGGDSQVNVIYATSPSGGSVVSGSANTTTTYSLGTSAGLLGAGNSLLLVDYNINATSGSLISGAVSVIASYVISGGVLTGTHSNESCIYNVSSSSGVFAGGNKYLVTDETASGGIQTSGSASEHVAITVPFVAQKDIELRYTGGSANADPNESLGGSISSFLVGKRINNLFDDVDTGMEPGTTDYRAFYVLNKNIRHTLSDVKVWIDTSNTQCDISIFVSSADEIAELIGTESNSPDVDFLYALGEENAVFFGDLQPNSDFYIWVRRVIPDNFTSDNDVEGFDLFISGKDSSDTLNLIRTRFTKPGEPPKREKPNFKGLRATPTVPINSHKGVTDLTSSIGKFLSQHDISTVYSGGSSNNDAKWSVGGSSSSYPIKNSRLFSHNQNVEYRAIYVFNDNEAHTLKNVKLWIETEGTSSRISIGVGSLNSTSPYTGFSNNAPSGVKFQPATKDKCIEIGDLEPLDGFFVWIKKVVPPNIKGQVDGFKLKLSGA